MAAPYQYPQYQQYQQQQQQQHHQYPPLYQQPQTYQQPAANGYSGYQQQYQQQPPTPQYSPQNYQQQYSNQQYSQQQNSNSPHTNQNYSYSGYPTQQLPATQQGSHPERQGSYAQQTGQTSSQSCFNCGILGHFAQNCPEPKRQVPAGALNPEHHRRQGIAPYKRGGGQIVTKFGPQGQLSQASPGAYTPAYSSGGYPQYPSSQPQTYTPSYTPTTPQSAPSSAQNWPQQGQQYSQQFQGYQQAQGGGYFQTSPPPQQSWPVPSTPASASGAPYGGPSASQASPSHSQYGQPAQTPQSLHGQGWGTPVRSTQQSPTPSQQLESATGNYPPETNSPEEYQQNPLGTRLFSPKPPPEIDEDAELEEDDLNLLELPDLPPSTAQYGEGVVTLVCMPIPSNFIVADALFPMDPPAPETQGRCYSKYSRNIQDDAVLQNIRDSVYWTHQREDPIFQGIAIDNDVIEVAECQSKVKDRRKSQEELLREARSSSRSAAPFKKDSVEAAASLEQLEKALAQAKADIANREKKQKGKKSLQNSDHFQTDSHFQQKDASIKAGSLSPPDSANIENDQSYENDAEDVLASLGVTGTAKPVGPPTRLVSQNSSATVETKLYRESASKAESNVPQTELAQPYQYTPDYAQDRRKSQPHDISPSVPYQKSHGRPTHIDGTAGNPHSVSSNSSGHRPNVVERTSGNYHYQKENQPLHPYQNRSASSGNRKRAYDERSSSEESEEEARRQEDDITPKLKRRQPKVAEAYSRRW